MRERPPTEPLRVVIADDSYIVREGLAALVREAPEVELVGAVADADALLLAVHELRPDVVVTDIRMPPTNTTDGIEAARKIRSSHPATGVLVLSQHLEAEYAAALLSDGAGGLGYLLKERVADLDELVRGVVAVGTGGTVLDPAVVEALLDHTRGGPPGPLTALSDREREVLAAMAEGRNNATIAAHLFLSDRAVEKHITSIFVKLGLTEEVEVHRRVMAVLAYLRATT